MPGRILRSRPVIELPAGLASGAALFSSFFSSRGSQAARGVARPGSLLRARCLGEHVPMRRRRRWKRIDLQARLRHPECDCVSLVKVTDFRLLAVHDDERLLIGRLDGHWRDGSSNAVEHIHGDAVGAYLGHLAVELRIVNALVSPPFHAGRRCLRILREKRLAVLLEVCPEHLGQRIRIRSVRPNAAQRGTERTSNEDALNSHGHTSQVSIPGTPLMKCTVRESHSARRSPEIRARKIPGAADGVSRSSSRQVPATGLYENFWPPTVAWTIAPPFTIVNTAIPL